MGKRRQRTSASAALRAATLDRLCRLMAAAAFGSHRQPEGKSRLARKYLATGNVLRLAAPMWVSQREAARELNVSVLRVGLLLANEHLEPAEDSERNMGVTSTRTSVAA